MMPIKLGKDPRHDMDVVSKQQKLASSNYIHVRVKSHHDRQYRKMVFFSLLTKIAFLFFFLRAHAAS